MKTPAFFLLTVLAATALSGCTDNRCGYGVGDGFDVEFINETGTFYYIYVYMPISKDRSAYTEDGFGSHGGGYAMAPGCEDPKTGRIQQSMYLHVEIREPKENHDEIRPPEKKGGPLVFEGNWTGVQCNEHHVFRYNGPDDVEAYEIQCGTFDRSDPDYGKRVKDLERVPP